MNSMKVLKSVVGGVEINYLRNETEQNFHGL
jgi:hypothetical protein